MTQSHRLDPDLFLYEQDEEQELARIMPDTGDGSENAMKPKGRFRSAVTSCSPADLKELTACQKEILVLTGRASEEISQLVRPALERAEERVRDRRNATIRRLPGFWSRAFFHHPRLAATVAEHERPVLRYLYNMEVFERRDVAGFRVFMHFRKNPYFTNQVLLKEFVASQYVDKSYIALVSPITWRPGQNFLKLTKRDSEPSFFRWFAQRRNVKIDEIATAIWKELWVHPLKYYLRQEAVESHEAPPSGRSCGSTL